MVDGTLTGDDIGDGTLTGFDIQDGFIGQVDIANRAINSAKVADNSLTGSDVDEASLGTVPSSVLGGFGRDGVRQNGQIGPGACDPEASTFINCDIAATLNLSRRARVLVIGSALALSETAGQPGVGQCQLGTTSGALTATTVQVTAGAGESEQLALAGVTGVFPAGQHAFGVDCNEVSSVRWAAARVTAVALSDQ